MSNAPDTPILTGPNLAQIGIGSVLITPVGGTQQPLAVALGNAGSSIDLTDLQNRVTALETSVDSIFGTVIPQLQAQITLLQASVVALQSPAPPANLQAQLDTINSRLFALENTGTPATITITPEPSSGVIVGAPMTFQGTFAFTSIPNGLEYRFDADAYADAPAGSSWGNGVWSITLPAPSAVAHTFTVRIKGTTTLDVSASFTPAAAPPPADTIFEVNVIIPSGSLAGTHVFSTDGGSGETVTDLGDYVDPVGDFTMANKLITQTSLPEYRVYYRPDTVGTTRYELVFELGDWRAASARRSNAQYTTVFNQAQADGQAQGLTGNALTTYTVNETANRYTTPNLPAHQVVIKQNGAVIVTKNLPAHYYYSRWRWQSDGGRPIRTSIATLQASKHLPLVSASLGFSTLVAPTRVAYTEMGYSNVVPDWTATGLSGNIGYLTEVCSYYVSTNGTLEAAMRDQAETAGTFPFHYRDTTTNCILDYVALPSASTFSYNSNGVTPYIPIPSYTNAVLDPSHQPSLSYVRFIQTGDPYDLENMQDLCIQNIIKNPPSSRPRFNLTPDTRAMAWAARDLIRLTAVCPTSVPAWLKNKAYWTTRCNGLRDFLSNTFVIGGASQFQTFRVFNCTDVADGPYPASCTTSLWQDDYAGMVMQQGAMLNSGDSVWVSIADWTASGVVSRGSTGNSVTGQPAEAVSFYREGLRPNTSTAYFTSWLAAWTDNKSRAGISINAGLMGTTQNGTLELMNYPCYARNHLALAAQRGYSGASAAFTVTSNLLSARVAATSNRPIPGYLYCISPT